MPEVGELSGAQLAQLLHEAARAAEGSLASALALADGQPPPRVGALVQHVSVLKRSCWETVAGALGTPAPPPELNLDGLCAWEVEAAAGLTAAQLTARLVSSGTETSVAELLRLNARQTVWHAGQIAALCGSPRLA